MTKSGMPSPFTPGGALQIPLSKAASSTDPLPGSSLPVLPPPPSPQDRVTSGEPRLAQHMLLPSTVELNNPVH